MRNPPRAHLGSLTIGGEVVERRGVQPVQAVCPLMVPREESLDGRIDARERRHVRNLQWVPSNVCPSVSFTPPLISFALGCPQVRIPGAMRAFLDTCLF